MTEHEKLMYQVLGRVSAGSAPIVFKGALITKLILDESGYSDVSRQTKDIDANWIGTPPSMDDLVSAINSSLGDLRSQFHAVAFRQYAERTSAGISIIRNDTDDEVMLMDISVKPVIGSRIYHYGEAEIRGVLANEILADKISVLSKRHMFRRAKDIVDVYALAHCVKVHTKEIFDIYKSNPSREVGAFTEFYSLRRDVEHAYNKLAGIDGKPPFDGVYVYLSKFLQPFARREELPKLWNSDILVWEAVPKIIGDAEKPSVIDEIRKAKKDRRDTSSHEHETTKRNRKNDTEL